MTDFIRLVPLDVEALRTLEEDPAGFEARHELKLGDAAETMLGVARHTAAWLESSPREAPWGAYLAVGGEGDAVGTCAFKDAPSPAGEVEIAYMTFPQFEGKGVAGKMAAELVAIARGAAPRVRRVIAHTLRERNASTRVLQRGGFRHAGEVEDPEDGPVWRWELDLAP